MKNINVETKYIGFEESEGDHKGDSELLVQTDEKRMQQVLMNLYSNAIKFSDRNGNILVTVEKVT